jgi:hypothetical protein
MTVKPTYRDLEKRARELEEDGAVLPSSPMGRPWRSRSRSVLGADISSSFSRFTSPENDASRLLS